MSTEYVDLTSPALNLFYDVNCAPLFHKDSCNYLNQLTAHELPVLRSTSFFDAHMTKNHIVEPHWHPNTTELVFVTHGEIVVSILNPFTKQLLTYRVCDHQAVYIPMGWWHWIIACSEHTHFITIFDDRCPQTVFGSDVLRITPKEVFQLAYCVDARQLAHVLSPIQNTTIIGPACVNAQAGASGYGGYGHGSAQGVQWRIGNPPPQALDEEEEQEQELQR
ncbi:cupin domain-containing protein [Paenibacillus sp. Leaf72]|uniref:cupin domain-containing protein n=1 Tax=Paenibacillus sp. Leaf72 TaxID=1736234 RepID=UPI0009D68199|nr:cupin domain-containing protein [Paenibacillus sp. Leaf72]